MNTSSGLLMPCVTLSTTIRLENMCVLGRVSLAEGEGETIVSSEAPPRRPPAVPDSPLSAQTGTVRMSNKHPVLNH